MLPTEQINMFIVCNDDIEFSYVGRSLGSSILRVKSGLDLISRTIDLTRIVGWRRLVF